MFRRREYTELEKRLGLRFRRQDLLREALTHRSYRYENTKETMDNQRLEFLGDAVLGLLTAAELFQQVGHAREGQLTAWRSRLANDRTLAEIARTMDLGRYLRVGRGEEASGGRDRPSLLADAVEALLGAAFLDGGLAAAGKVFDSLFRTRMHTLEGDVLEGNPKGRLQEYSQREWQSPPTYEVLDESGPSHARRFRVAVWLPDGSSAEGIGSSKQRAGTEAARELLAKIDAEEKNVFDNLSAAG